MSGLDTQLTPLRFLDRAAEVHPESIGIVDGDRRLTNAEFAAAAQSLAGALRDWGIAPGDRVAYLATNRAELLIAHYGVPLAGGVLVAINTRLSPDEVAYICGHSGSSLLLGDADLLDALGDVELPVREVISLDDIEHFAEFTGDKFYAHMDQEAAEANPFFPGRVAHGYLLLSFAAGLFVEPAPGPVLANTGLDNLRFMTPVSPGDSLRVTLTAKQITPRETDPYGEVRWDAVLTNQDDETVAQYDLLTYVAKEQ